MPEIANYGDTFYSMMWIGPEGYPQNANSGRCYFTGILGMLRFHGETDMLFADGSSGDGFSFRWCPSYGAPAFNGGKGPFHELWEYTPRAMGFKSYWVEDHEGGWEEAWAQLRGLIDRGVPVQVGVHYSRMRPYAIATSPRLAHTMKIRPSEIGYGHHVVIAGYDLDKGTVVVWEPNEKPENSRFVCPIPVFRRAWEESSQRVNRRYEEWPSHFPWKKEWSLHDGYGPYAMVWIEPGRDPKWDVVASIRDSFRRNLRILRGDFPKPYALFGSQWQIPHWETGAPGMQACIDAIRSGRLSDADVALPDGTPHKLFVHANIGNHGVLGRAGAAGYLRRVGTELEKRGHDPRTVTRAAEHMLASSETFRKLRYEGDAMRCADLLEKIAREELAALDLMERAWPGVLEMAKGKPVRASAAE